MKANQLDKGDVVFVKPLNKEMIYMGLDHQSKENGHWVDQFKVGRITKDGQLHEADRDSIRSMTFPIKDFKKTKKRIEY